MTHRTLDTPDGQLAAIDTGHGPTVVFVHGTPSSSFTFRHVIASLGREHRSVAIDHLGFGGSDKPADADYSVRAHQRRFARAMELLQVEEAVFVLHDFGSSIAVPWLLAHPDRVRGVVIANTFLWPASGAIRWILAFYATFLGRWLYRAANISVRALLPWAWGKHTPLTPDVHAAYLAPFASFDERHATAALPAELIGPTLEELAKRASELGRFPVRAVWGMADPLAGPGELEKWKAILPDLRVEEVAAAGHFVADEAPDAIQRAVLSLLQETADGLGKHADRQADDSSAA